MTAPYESKPVGFVAPSRGASEPDPNDEQLLERQSRDLNRTPLNDKYDALVDMLRVELRLDPEDDVLEESRKRIRILKTPIDELIDNSSIGQALAELKADPDYEPPPPGMIESIVKAVSCENCRGYGWIEEMVGHNNWHVCKDCNILGTRPFPFAHRGIFRRNPIENASIGQAIEALPSDPDYMPPPGLPAAIVRTELCEICKGAGRLLDSSEIQFTCPECG